MHTAICIERTAAAPMPGGSSLSNNHGGGRPCVTLSRISAWSLTAARSTGGDAGVRLDGGGKLAPVIIRGEFG